MPNKLNNIGFKTLSYKAKLHYIFEQTHKKWVAVQKFALIILKNNVYNLGTNCVPPNLATLGMIT